MRRIDHPLVLVPDSGIREADVANFASVRASVSASIVMDVIVVELKDGNLLECIWQGVRPKLLADSLQITHFEGGLGNGGGNIGLLNRQLLALTRRVQAHELGVAALHSAVHICALYVELFWVVMGIKHLVVFDVTLTIPAAKQVALAHT